jgi:hypothetical protein
MADAANAPEFLDIDVPQVARPRPLVPPNRDRGLALAQPRQAVAARQAPDGRGAALQRGGDLRARPDCRRRVSTQFTRTRGVAVGRRRGRHERSTKPPSALVR